jgi:phage-related protein
MRYDCGAARRPLSKQVREVRFIGAARDELSVMPQDVKYEVGSTLWQIQIGETPAHTKQLRGKLRDVREIIVDDDGNTYRTMYTTRIGDVVYVLDAFMKKSKKGIATPQRDLDRIEQRLKLAREDYEKES